MTSLVWWSRRRTLAALFLWSIASAAIAEGCGGSKQSDGEDGDAGSSGEGSGAAGGEGAGGSAGASRGGEGASGASAGGSGASSPGGEGGDDSGGSLGNGGSARGGSATGGEGAMNGGSDTGGGGSTNGGTSGDGGTGGSGGTAGGECGDGVVGGSEQCDDGNRVGSDGCSSSCQLDPGFICTEKRCGASGCTLRLPAVYRDFRASGTTGGHADFANATGMGNIVPGLVQAALDSEGKPVFSGQTGGFIQSTTSFSEWYRDSSFSTKVVSTLLMFQDANDTSFYIRSNDQGDRVKGYPFAASGTGDVQYCHASSCADPACAVTGERECSYPCVPFPGTDFACTATARYYDGDPLFFPLDGVTSSEPRYTATIPPAYGQNFTAEPGGALHNFYFTMEMRFRARYSEGNSVQLGLSSDDDAWLFVNGQLALDSGGKHTPSEGYTLVTVAPFAESFGLTEGDIYELVLFYADRSANGAALSFFMTQLDHVPSCMRTN